MVIWRLRSYRAARTATIVVLFLLPLVAAMATLATKLSWVALIAVVAGYPLGMVIQLSIIRQATKAARVPPSNLPPPPTRMIGREQEVERLKAYLLDARQGRRIANVFGVAGIGKTAFALDVAHRVANQFKGGELFAHFDPDLEAEEAVRDVRRQLVQTLQPRQTSSLEEPADQSVVYRRLIRKLSRKRQLLIVLDDVPSAAAVEQILPETPWCAVIITSRRRIDGVRATSFRIDQLSGDAALQMLATVISGERVEQEPAVARSMVAAAAQHPLAIQLVGMALANRPHTRLSVARDRMNEGTRSEAAGADQFDNALNLSYAMLARSEQDALTRLGLLDQRRFAAWELAALMDMDETEAWKICERLSDAGLVARHSSDVTGVQFFVLLEHVERYAGLRAADLSPEESAAIRERQGSARRRRLLLETHVREVFERVQVIVEQGLISRAFKEVRDVIALARELGDDYGEAEATAMLAELHGELGGSRDVLDLLILPLDAEASLPRIRALRVRAKLHRRLRQVEEARCRLGEAIALNAKNPDRVEAVRLLREVAIVESVGRTPQAGLIPIQDAMARIEGSAESARLFAGLAYAQGRVLLAIGDPATAVGILAEGVERAQRNRQDLWRAWLVYERAKAAFVLGECESALGSTLGALDEFNGLRHRYGGAHCRQLIGRILYQQEDFEGAIRFLSEALETFHSCGDGWIEADAAEQLAEAYRRTGQKDKATELKRAARRILLSINVSREPSGFPGRILPRALFREGARS